MTKKRDTMTYDLKRGRKVVYKGTTNNPEVREQQHRDQGKQFNRLLVTSHRMTPDGAKAKEEMHLEQYRQTHRGRNPTYNKDSDG